jgi:hypothetical protein
MRRCASIKSECELVQVIRQMRRSYCPLMRSENPSLEQRRNQVWQPQVVWWDNFVNITMLLDSVVSFPIIGTNDARWVHGLHQKLQQIFLGRGLDMFKANSAHPFFFVTFAVLIFNSNG